MKNRTLSPVFSKIFFYTFPSLRNYIAKNTSNIPINFSNTLSETVTHNTRCDRKVSGLRFEK